MKHSLKGSQNIHNPPGPLRAYFALFKKTLLFGSLFGLLLLSAILLVLNNYQILKGYKKPNLTLGSLTFEPLNLSLSPGESKNLKLWLIPPKKGQVLSFKIEAQGLSFQFKKNPKLASLLSEDQGRISVDIANLPGHLPKHFLLGELIVEAKEPLNSVLEVPSESLLLDDQSIGDKIDLSYAKATIKVNEPSKEETKKDSQTSVSNSVSIRDITISASDWLSAFTVSADENIKSGRGIKIQPTIIFALAFLLLTILIYLSVKLERILSKSFSKKASSYPRPQSFLLKKSFGYQISRKFYEIKLKKKVEEENGWVFYFEVKNSSSFSLKNPYFRFPIPEGWRVEESSVFVDDAQFHNYQDGNAFYILLATFYPEEVHHLKIKLTPAST